MSERDVEKEHHAQLRRWRETHGELRCKSPPRMHGARAIMKAEPPSRQDLKQMPTIVVDSPLGPPSSSSSSSSPGHKKEEEKEEEDEEEAREKGTGNNTLLYRVHSTAQPLQKDTPLQASTHSVSSAEQDTYL